MQVRDSGSGNNALAYQAVVMFDLCTDFITVAYTDSLEYYSMVVIGAGYNDTVVRIFHGDVPNLQFVSVTLDAMDTYTIRGEDLTGIMVRSNKPISIICGTARGTIPYWSEYRLDGGALAPPPLAYLGFNHIVPWMVHDLRPDDVGYIVRIVAPYENTGISFYNNYWLDLGIIHHGQFVEQDVQETSAVTLVKCTRPCLVVQLSKANLHVADTSPNQDKVDTFMWHIPDVNHYYNNITISTMALSKQESLFAYGIIIVLLTQYSYILSVHHPDEIFTEAVIPHWGEYTIVTTEADPGQHILADESFKDVDNVFCIWTYGVNPTISYGHSAGFAKGINLRSYTPSLRTVFCGETCSEFYGA